MGADLTEADLALTLAHELRHAYQDERGQDTWTAHLAPDQYEAHPAERDARAWEVLAVNSYALERNTLALLDAAWAAHEREQRWERGAASIAAAFAAAERDEESRR